MDLLQISCGTAAEFILLPGDIMPWLCGRLVQGMMLLFAGPVVDHWVSGRDVLSYKWTQGALQQLMLSCGVAVAVNISQFMCLGRFSAVTFQVRVLCEGGCGGDAPRTHEAAVELQHKQRIVGP
jgi:hypothetical protein